VAQLRLFNAAPGSRRLFKQRLEAEEILQEITGRSDRWKNHPAVRMWKGYAPALTGYVWCISRAAKGRGLDYITLDEQKMEHIAKEAGVWPDIPHVIAEFMEDELPDFTTRPPVDLPPWWADDRLYLSHRSALLRKAKEGWRKGHEEGNNRYLGYSTSGCRSTSRCSAIYPMTSHIFGHQTNQSMPSFSIRSMFNKNSF
jgi:hypothetical protein